VLQAELACALDAIRTHRDACDTADIEPEPHDLALWNTWNTSPPPMMI
jgi:hypothetical protein